MTLTTVVSIVPGSNIYSFPRHESQTRRWYRGLYVSSSRGEWTVLWDPSKLVWCNWASINLAYCTRAMSCLCVVTRDPRRRWVRLRLNLGAHNAIGCVWVSVVAWLTCLCWVCLLEISHSSRVCKSSHSFGGSLLSIWYTYIRTTPYQA